MLNVMIDTLHDTTGAFDPSLFIFYPSLMAVGEPCVGVRYVQISLDYYRRESAKIITIFKESLLDGEIGKWSGCRCRAPTCQRLWKPFVPLPEKASIDEAFIDFTQPVRAELLARYPYLAEVPPDAPDGLDTVLPPAPEISWVGRGNLIPIDPPSEDEAAEPPHATGTNSEVADGEEGTLRTWHDVALSIAAELMDKIRAEVRMQLGYTTSAVSFRRVSSFRIQLMDSHLSHIAACHRVLRGTNSLPRCVGCPIRPFFLRPSFTHGGAQLTASYKKRDSQVAQCPSSRASRN